MRLRPKILLLLTPLLMVPAIGLALFASQQLEDDLRRNHAERINAVTGQLQESTERRIEQASLILTLLQTNALLNDYLAEASWARYTLMELPLLKLFHAQIAASPDLHDIHLLQPDGTHELSARQQPPAGERPRYADRVLAGDGERVNAFKFQTEAKLPVLLFAVPISGKEKVGEPVGTQPHTLGYLVLEYSLDFLARQFAQLADADTGLLLIDVRDGERILQRLPADITLPEKQLRGEIRSGGNEQPRSAQLAERDFLLVSKTLPIRLQLVGLVPESVLHVPATELRNFTLLAAVTLTALAVLVLYFSLDLLFLGRLRFLATQLARAGRGLPLPEPASIRANDEIGLITRSYLQAQRELRDSTASTSRTAYRDPLTELPNIVTLRDNIDSALQMGRRYDRMVGLLFLDLDDFQKINESHGHEAGDAVLRTTAQRLKQCVRSSDSITTGTSDEQLHMRPGEQAHQGLTRLGGDEFSILLTELNGAGECALVAQRIVDCLAQPVRIAGSTEIRISASIGISIYPDDGDSPDELLKRADVAMYRAKAAGKNTYRFFDKAVNERIHARIQLASEIREGLEHGAFLLHYQPLFDWRDPDARVFEALLRWQHPRRGMLDPGQFLAVAEEAGLGPQLGGWVIEEACRQLRAWHELGDYDSRIGINLSASQLQHGSVLEQLLKALGRHGVRADRLEVEFSEHLLVRCEERARRLITTLSQLQFSVTLDDFGSGPASLNWLRELPLQTVKVDASLVRDLEDDLGKLKLLEAITDLAGALRRRTVAKGVERRNQSQILKTLGIDAIQGYYYCKPADADSARGFFDRPRAPQAADAGEADN